MHSKLPFCENNIIIWVNYDKHQLGVVKVIMVYAFKSVIFLTKI